MSPVGKRFLGTRRWDRLGGQDGIQWTEYAQAFGVQIAHRGFQRFVFHRVLKRGYLLPEGCKDLNDVLEKQKQAEKRLLIMLPLGMLKMRAKATKKFIKLTKWFGGPST